MRVQIPKQVNIINLVVFLSLLSAAGYAAFYFSGKVWVGVVLSLLLFVFVPIVKRISINSAFSKHLRRFGEDFDKEYSQEIYDSSIMGFIPFNGQNMHCSVFADESGIFVIKRGTKRHIPWSMVIGHKALDYLGLPVIEINLENYEQSNRLVIPWSPTFSKFIP